MKKKTKEIEKYPINAIIGEESQLYFSDQICKQIISISYRNGRIFCTIKNRISNKKKTIVFSFILLFGGIVSVPKEARPMRLTPAVRSATPEIHRPAKRQVNQHAPTINPRLNKIQFIRFDKLPVCFYIMDEKFKKTSEFSKLISNLRGGDFYSVGNLLLCIFAFWQIVLEGDSFQVPIVNPHHNGIHRPANGGLGGIQRQINYPKHKGRIIAQMSQSNDSPAHHQSQIKQIKRFLKNGEVDLQQCLDKVRRRALALGCTNFKCSMERFKALATENGKLTDTSARETIPIGQYVSVFRDQIISIIFFHFNLKNN